MSNIVAGIGRGQMQVLDKHIGLRRKMHDFYANLFKDVKGVRVFTEPNTDYYSNHWLSCILIDEKITGFSREDLRIAFLEANIESRPLWKPMHMQPVFKNAPFYGSGVSEKLFEDGLCLPSGSNLTDEDRQRIKQVLLDFI
jgi:dTDP-4-amino-4,6-dideoxygalactose transaminase